MSQEIHTFAVFGVWAHGVSPRHAKRRRMIPGTEASSHIKKVAKKRAEGLAERVIGREWAILDRAGFGVEKIQRDTNSESTKTADDRAR